MKNEPEKEFLPVFAANGARYYPKSNKKQIVQLLRAGGYTNIGYSGKERGFYVTKPEQP